MRRLSDSGALFQVQGLSRAREVAPTSPRAGSGGAPGRAREISVRRGEQSPESHRYRHLNRRPGPAPAQADR